MLDPEGDQEHVLPNVMVGHLERLDPGSCQHIGEWSGECCGTVSVLQCHGQMHRFLAIQSYSYDIVWSELQLTQHAHAIPLPPPRTYQCYIHPHPLQNKLTECHD